MPTNTAKASPSTPSRPCPPNRFSAMMVASDAVAVSIRRSPTRMVSSRRCGSVLRWRAISARLLPWSAKARSLVSLTE